MKPAPVFCPACEAPTAARTQFGYIGDDGRMGSISGVSCPVCRYLDVDPDAVPVLDDGPPLDLEGLRAFAWFVRSLRAAGCDPRPRP
jgi:hypothetical protein